MGKGVVALMSAALNLPGYGLGMGYAAPAGQRIVRPVHCYACEQGMSVGDIFSDIGDFVSDAASCAGRILEEGGRLLSEIPVIGGIFTAAFKIFVAPYSLVLDIAHGANIIDAVIDNAKSAIAAVHVLAPYIQAVLSVVPGIGTGLSAAISGGLALAAGMPIDQILIEAVKGAIPGGPLAQAAFIVAAGTMSAVAHGGDIGSALENAAVKAGTQLLKFAPNILDSLSIGAKALSDGAGGAAMDALNTVTKAIPPEAMRGFELAVAFGAGSSIQSNTLDQVQRFGSSQLQQMAGDGLKKAVDTDVLASGLNKLTGGQMSSNDWEYLLGDPTRITRYATTPDMLKNVQLGVGYQLGIGLQSTFAINENIITTIRDKVGMPDALGPTGLGTRLTGSAPSGDPTVQRVGFDFALATHIGAVKGAPMPATSAIGIAAKSLAASLGLSNQSAASLSAAANQVAMAAKSKSSATALSSAARAVQSNATAVALAAAAASVKAGYYTALGTVSAATYQKAAIDPVLVSSPAMKAGALAAAAIVEQQLTGSPWEVFANVRSIAARLSAGDPATSSSVAQIRTQAAAGDGRAKKLLLMIDLVKKIDDEERVALANLKTYKLDSFELFWAKILDIPRSLTRGL